MRSFRHFLRGVGLLAALAASIRAADFVVTQDSDEGDGSLRNALVIANQSPGPHRITFDIPGIGPHTIRLLSELPPIRQTIELDGFTQPGSQPNTLPVGNNSTLNIELSGELAGDSARGLVFEADGCLVRGMVINGFLSSPGFLPQIQVLVTNGHGNRIEACFIGTDRAGSTLIRGGGKVLIADATNTVIGGKFPGQRNLIAGNATAVELYRADNTRVQGNYLQTDRDGLSPLGNRFTGAIYVKGFNNLIGGPEEGMGNLMSLSIHVDTKPNNPPIPNTPDHPFSNGNVIEGNFIGTDRSGLISLGNLGHGIYLENCSSNVVRSNLISGNGMIGILMSGGGGAHVIQGNKIGVGSDGSSSLGNGGAGVAVELGREGVVEIGGTQVGDGNIIAHNGTNGVLLISYNGITRILRNSIYGNGGLGIDISKRGDGLGITPNDLGDLDGGPNDGQNFPVLTNAVLQNSEVTVQGVLRSTKARPFRVELFRSASANLRAGVGEQFVTFTNVTTDAEGNAPIEFRVPDDPGRRQYTTTATDADGNTSEFSIGVRALDANQYSLTDGLTDIEVAYGGKAVLEVFARGPEPLALQWYHGISPIPNATHSTFEITGATANDIGSYFLVGSNASTKLTSRTVTLSVVNMQPQMNTAPKDARVFEGSPIALHSGVVGQEPLSFQWSRIVNGNPIPIPWATNSSIEFSAVKSEDQGIYQVRVSNNWGVLLAPPVTLSVMRLPQFASFPSGLLVTNRGANITLRVSADIDENTVLRWYKDGTVIEGTTGLTLDLQNVSVLDQGIYFLRVQVGDAVATSQPLQLRVTNPARIIVGPKDQKLADGSTLVAQVLATGDEPLMYQWRNMNGDLVGETNSTLVITNVAPSDAGSYGILVRNEFGSATASFNLIVINVPRVLIPTLTRAGNSAELSITPQGDPPFRFQWIHNGTMIPSATNSALSIAPVTTADGGAYQVIVANEIATVVSGATNIVVPAESMAALDDLDPTTIHSARLPTTGHFTIVSTNSGFSKQRGEPKHGGRFGGKSAWFYWRTNVAGVLRLNTQGSTFDTLLAAYQGTNIQSLQMIDEDDDRGAYLTSEVQFSIIPDTDYAIAVDGVAGASGPFVLSGDFTTNITAFPRFVRHPQSLSVTNAGAFARFDVDVSGHDITYQWFFLTNLLSGETRSFLEIPQVSLSSLGYYFVQASNKEGVIVSRKARLEFGPDARTVTDDKFEPELGLPSQGAKSPVQLQSTSGPAQGSLLPFIHRPSNESSSTSHQISTNVYYNYSYRRVDMDAIATYAFTATCSNATPVLRLVAGYDVTYAQGVNSILYQNQDAPAIAFLEVVTIEQTPSPTITVIQSWGTPPNATNVALTSPAVTETNLPIGKALALQVLVDSTLGDVRIRWYRNNVFLANETNSSLLFPSVDQSHAGRYSVIASNLFGTLTQNVATVRILPPPVIVNDLPERFDPHCLNVLQVSATLESASGPTNTGLTYQWRMNGQDLKGATATNDTLLVPATVTTGDKFSVVVSSLGGSVTSAVAQASFPTVSILNPSGELAEGTPLTIQASLSPDLLANLSGTWLKDGNADPQLNTLGTTLKLKTLKPTDAGSYVFVVNRYPCDEIRSNPFELRVRPKHEVVTNAIGEVEIQVHSEQAFEVQSVIPPKTGVQLAEARSVDELDWIPLLSSPVIPAPTADGIKPIATTVTDGWVRQKGTTNSPREYRVVRFVAFESLTTSNSLSNTLRIRGTPGHEWQLLSNDVAITSGVFLNGEWMDVITATNSPFPYRAVEQVPFRIKNIRANRVNDVMDVSLQVQSKPGQPFWLRTLEGSTLSFENAEWLEEWAIPAANGWVKLHITKGVYPSRFWKALATAIPPKP